MSRLPIVNGDDGTWGDILNDYLLQSHKNDGLLKDNAVTSNALAPNSVTNAAIATDAVNATSIADGSITNALLADGTIAETKLDTTVQTKLNQVAPTWSTLSGKPAVIAAGADAAEARAAAEFPTVVIKPGITNAELNNIFTNNNEIVVQATPGVYTGLDGVVTIKSGQSLIANGAIFVSDSLQFQSYGMPGGTLPGTGFTNLTANQQSGGFRITLPTGEGANWAENDVVYICADNNVSYDAWTDEWAKPTELHQVQAVSGDVLHLTKSLVHDYTTANVARVRKISMKSGISIKGATFKNATLTAFPRPAVIDFCQQIGTDIDVTCINAGQIHVRDFIGGRIKAHIETAKPWDTLLGTPLGYGVYLTGVGHSTEVFVTGWGARHIFTTHGSGGSSFLRTGPYSTVVRGSGRAGSQYESHSVFDTHPHAYDTTFVGCVADAGDNSLTGARRDNAAFATRGHRTTLLGCRGRAYYAAVRADGQSTGTRIIGGHFVATDATDGVGVLARGDGVQVLGAVIDAPVAVWIQDDSSNLSHVEVPSGTLVKGCYLRSTIAAIKDDSNGGAGDTAAIETDNTYEIVSGSKFVGFVGKALTASPVVDEFRDPNGNELVQFEPTTNAVNHVSIKNSVSGSAPQIKAVGDNTNIALNLVTKGTGLLFWNSVAVPSISSISTLTNKTLTSPKVSSGNAPATASSTGTEGQIEWDANFIYVCVATNTWKRAALSTW